MPHRTSRRDVICDAALDLAAMGGNHALTHRGIDTHLGLARGSTSYYFRTRHALVDATITFLARRSREFFVDADFPDDVNTVVGATGVVASQLHHLITARRRDVLARYGLVADAAGDDKLRVALAGCLFSHPAATRLMTALGAADPEIAAHHLIGLLEGLAFAHTCGLQAPNSDDTTVGDLTASLSVPVQRMLDALVG